MKSSHNSFRRFTTGLTFSLLVFAADNSASAASKTNTKTGEKAGASVTTGTGNTAIGSSALTRNKTGKDNTAVGNNALKNNLAGGFNTALGSAALTKSTGNNNTAIGNGANVSSGNLTNATAIGSVAIVNASNKIRLGSSVVTVLECQVGLTITSDRTTKESFLPVSVDKKPNEHQDPTKP